MTKWVADYSWLVVLLPVLVPGAVIGLLLSFFSARED